MKEIHDSAVSLGHDFAVSLQLNEEDEKEDISKGNNEVFMVTA